MIGSIDRAIVIDDEPDILDFVSRALRNRYQVRRCRNPLEAERCLAEEGYSLLITDLRMPGICGLKLLERIGPEYPGLARVLLSGYAELGEMERALDQGVVDAYALKPVDTATLLRVSEQATQRRASRRIAS